MHTQLAAAVFGAAAAAVVVAAVAAAVAEQEQQDDDPPPVVAAEPVADTTVIIATHKHTSGNLVEHRCSFPCYSRPRKMCSGVPRYAPGGNGVPGG